MDLKIKDVRAEMPNFHNYKDWQRNGPIAGIAIHHSATADPITGAPIGDAYSFFDYQVNVQGWTHGGYNYVITGSGEVQYALDEKIAAYHAGFKDPSNSAGLEYGQYWNNHYLAICLSGWFSSNRTHRDAGGYLQPIPNNYTSPAPAQLEPLLALVQHLRQKYGIPAENVRAHRELAGNSTVCPGSNLDPADLRARLRALDETQPAPEPEPGPPAEVQPGEHVLLLPDADKYLEAAMFYIWKFQPDVSFSINEAQGRWKYVTAVGSPDVVSEDQITRLLHGGALLVQRISGDPPAIQTTLDGLVEANRRFAVVPPAPTPSPTPEPQWRSYTVQPGDTLSLIARQVYGEARLWRVIFEANHDILSDPGRVRPGQVLKIPPKPA